MRILYIVPYVPNLIRVRPFNLIRHLHERGNHVTVATIVTNAQERQQLRELANYCSEVKAVGLGRWRSFANCAAALATSEPLQSHYSWSSKLMAEIDSLRDRADVVHVEHLRGARYGLEARSRPTSGVPIVWDSVDCISDLFDQALRNRSDSLGRWINRLELDRTRAYEGWAVTQFDRVLVTSANDKASLRRLSANRKDDSTVPSKPGRASRAETGDRITVLPNGVDLDYFAPTTDDRVPNGVVFSGKLSYHANRTAATHLLTSVMPHVWAQRPDVKLWLVGKDPSSDLLRMASSCSGRVVITGTVPDVRPFLRQAAVAVAPLVYGVGCQNKVLEAMGCETPVVATARSIGALSAVPGRDVVIADEPLPFAEAVLGLLECPARRREVGRAGRAYVETHHRWDRVAARLEGIYEEVVAARASRPLERIAG